MKTLMASRIHADHASATAFNKDLEAFVKRREAIVERLRSQAEELYATMQKAYRYEVKDASSEPYLPENVRALKPVRVVRHWLNKDDFDRAAKTYGVALKETREKTVCSVVYYRLNGLLLCVPGTGANVLKANTPYDDEAWNNLVSRKTFFELEF